MSDLVNQAIVSGLMTQYMLSKIEFNNAKDTRQMMDAAQANHDMLISAVEYRIASRIEELVQERLQDCVSNGKFIVRIGDKFYDVKENHDV